MSTTIICYQMESGTLPFRDEIFQWPIAKMVNIDVWGLMFDKYLTSPLDKKSLLFASPQFFGPLLMEEKCSILLGEVLHILQKNDYLNLTNGEFLKYRTLSKSCKISIDRCLQLDNPCFQNLIGIDHDHDEYYSPYDHFCWERWDAFRRSSMYENITEVASMIKNEKIQVGTSNPFMCGYLAFSRSGYSNTSVRLTPHLENFRLVLSTVGTQIYHFRLDLSCDSPWFVGKLLCEFLGMMPNLQTLILDNIDVVKSSILVRTIEQKSLPSLENLQVLKTINVPSKMVKELIGKYGRQLKKISVNLRQKHTNYTYENGILYPAINLTELSLPRITTEFSIGQHLRGNVRHAGTLECLSVSIAIREAKPQSSGIFQELTSAVRDLFETGKLHTLNLFVEKFPWDFVNDFFDAGVRLKLPSLKRLWIQSLCVEISSIDFILGVSDTLEELTLSMARCTPKDKGQQEIIQFVRFWKRMEESNVWKHMPMLQKITIKIRATTTSDSSETRDQEYISSRPSMFSSYVK